MKSRDRPVVLAVVYIVGEEIAGDHFVRTRFMSGNDNVLDEAPVAGGVHSAGLCFEVIPCVNFGLYAPLFLA